MEQNHVLQVEHLHKVFRLYPTPAARLVERLTGRIRHREHVALQDVSFALKAGETVGVLGCNGAGKSTLLKLILGVLKPDSGRIASAGRITGLLELGTGFDATLTGRQNIYVNGILLGMSREQLREREEKIIEFAELGEYIDDPLRTYSSGMAMRLGFAISIHAEPSCFVVDEALAVGDARFQQKCLDRIRQFTREGGAILFVSHDLNAVRLLCSRALVLHKGQLVFDGESETAGRVYYRILGGDGADGPDTTAPGWGKQDVVIRSVRFVDASFARLESLTAGSTATLCLDIQAKVTRQLTAGFMIRDRVGQELFGTNTALLDNPLQVRAGERYRVSFDFPVHLGPGAYTVSASLHGGMAHTDDCEHWLDGALSFKVDGYPNYHCVGPVWQPILRVESRPHDSIEE